MALYPEYLTVEQAIDNIIIINKSRFITTIVPIQSFEQAMLKLKEISKRYSDATHNCYAMIYDKSGQAQKFSDDGEPQGTAGYPMLEVLKKQNVHMALAVVTRYFGGIKLGSGGLVLAYTNSVVECLKKANLVTMQWSQFIELECDYSLSKFVEKAVQGVGKIANIDYQDNVKFDIVVGIDMSQSLIEKLRQSTLGKATISCVKQDYYAFDTK